MSTIADSPLLDEPILRRHFDGRPVELLGLDTVLADLHQLGRVTLSVGSEPRRTGAVARFRCRLRLRGTNGECSASASSSLDAALGCLLRALAELEAYGAAGVEALERHAHAESSAAGREAEAGLRTLDAFLAHRAPARRAGNLP